MVSDCTTMHDLVSGKIGTSNALPANAYINRFWPNVCITGRVDRLFNNNIIYCWHACMKHTMLVNSMHHVQAGLKEQENSYLVHADKTTCAL